MTPQTTSKTPRTDALRVKIFRDGIFTEQVLSEYATLETELEQARRERETQDAAIQRHRERMEAVNPGHDFGSFGDSISFLCDAHEELKKERTSLQKRNEKLRDSLKDLLHCGLNLQQENLVREALNQKDDE